jgi:hypothetical protein
MRWDVRSLSLQHRYNALARAAQSLNGNPKPPPLALVGRLSIALLQALDMSGGIGGILDFEVGYRMGGQVARVVGPAVDPVSGNVGLIVDPDPNGRPGFGRVGPGIPPELNAGPLQKECVIELGRRWSNRRLVWQIIPSFGRWTRSNANSMHHAAISP